MQNKKAFTVIELLVAIAITSVLLAAVYFTYNNLFKKSKYETYIAEAEIEKTIGLDLIRLDIEHAGFGITDVETCPTVRFGTSFPSPSDCDDDLSFSQNALVIRSMINNTNQKEIGWVYVDCTSGAWPTGAPSLIDERMDNTNNNLIFIDATSGNFAATGTFGTCPGTGIYLAYPYDSLTNMDNCVDLQYCHRIVYKLSSTTEDYCHPSTRSLLRGIDGTASSGGNPILHCIGGMEVKVDIDTDSDGITDLEYQDFSVLDINGDGVVASDEIINHLSRVHVYFLMQVGKKDPKFTFPKSTLSINEGGTTVEFDLSSLIGSGYQNYRWKIVKISVVPMNLIAKR